MLHTLVFVENLTSFAIFLCKNVSLLFKRVKRLYFTYQTSNVVLKYSKMRLS